MDERDVATGGEDDLASGDRSPPRKFWLEPATLAAMRGEPAVCRAIFAILLLCSVVGPTLIQGCGGWKIVQ